MNEGKDRIDATAEIIGRGRCFEIRLRVNEGRWGLTSCGKARKELLRLIDDTVDKLLEIAEGLEEPEDYPEESENGAAGDSEEFRCEITPDSGENVSDSTDCTL